MEKTISIRQTEITFSIWDLGGEFGVTEVVRVSFCEHRTARIREYAATRL